jgi:beta-N-acetylhexosaminidase
MVLHCNGKLDEMRDVVSETPVLAGQALQRAQAALAARRQPQPFDRVAGRAELDALIARAGASA